ncbi:MAG: tetratricopeptide repeat protein [Stagnimonas sp.]|nr:tetratricopeptide repeat protein [Stagnimonas sp.]
MLDWREKYYRKGHYLTNMTRLRIGEALTLDGRAAEAVPLLQEVLVDSTHVLGEQHPHTLDILRILAEAELALGKPQQAEADFRLVLQRANKMAANNNRLTWARYGLGRALLAQGKTYEARPFLIAAQHDFSRYFGPHYSVA